jgi:hypothetical protein
MRINNEAGACRMKQVQIERSGLKLNLKTEWGR